MRSLAGLLAPRFHLAIMHSETIFKIWNLVYLIYCNCMKSSIRNGVFLSCILVLKEDLFGTLSVLCLSLNTNQKDFI